MSEQETTETTFTQLHEVVKPFAEAIDGPSWRVSQTSLDDLQALHEADDHPDFSLESYGAEDLLTLRAGALFQLPFRLSMGLHSSVRPASFDIPDTVETFSAYQEVTPLWLTSGGYSESSRRRKRAQSALSGAIIDAAADQKFIPQVTEAISMSRDLGLISRRTGKILQKSRDSRKPLLSLVDSFNLISCQHGLQCRPTSAETS